MTVTQQLNGFLTTYTGLLRNVRAVDRKNTANTKQWVENMLDFEHMAHDGRPVMVEFRLSKAAMEAGMFAQLKTLIGKRLTFSVVSNERVWNGHIYKDYYFSDRQLPTVVNDVAVRS